MTEATSIHRRTRGPLVTAPAPIVVRHGRFNRRSLPPTMRLRQLFIYDPVTGSLKWRNGKCAGQEAGYPDQFGYKRTMVDGRAYQLHRLIWKMCAWADPEHEIDHRNGNKSDNSWLNLRPATILQNAKNRSRNRNNTSGHTGVYWHKHRKCWCARIQVDGRKVSLGYFDDPAKAYEARQTAAAKHFGEFARQ